MVSVLAHLLARECAARVAGGRPADVTVAQRCPTCGSAGHGKPSVAGVEGVHVSLSRSRGTIAATAAHSPVGIDVERADGRPLHDEALMATVLAPAEIAVVRAAPDPGRAFLRHWVRKEALRQGRPPVAGRSCRPRPVRAPPAPS